MRSHKKAGQNIAWNEMCSARPVTDQAKSDQAKSDQGLQPRPYMKTVPPATAPRAKRRAQNDLSRIMFSIIGCPAAGAWCPVAGAAVAGEGHVSQQHREMCAQGETKSPHVKGALLAKIDSTCAGKLLSMYSVAGTVLFAQFAESLPARPKQGEFLFNELTY